MREDGPAPLDLPGRLEVGATAFGDGTYADLRTNGAAWIRDGVPGAEALGETLETLEPLLGRSFLLGQPNLAGMGVGAWDLAVATPAEAILERAQARSRRMIGGGSLAGFFEDDEGRRGADDPAALQRGADLVEAIQQLDAAVQDLPEEAPEDLAAQAARLRAELSGRLQGERRHHRGLDRALRGAGLDDPLLPTQLRGTPERSAPKAPAPAPQADAYTTAIEATLAREMMAPAAVEGPDLAALRQRIATAAEAALAAPADSNAARRLTERARRLLAEEIERTGGRAATPGAVDTVGLRRALAERETRTPRPTEGALRPRADLPEVPIWSSRGDKRTVVGYLRADERIDALRQQGGQVQVPVPGRSRPGWIGADLLDRAPLALRGPQIDPARAPSSKAGGAPPPDLARLAALVARETGESVTALLKQALEDPEFAKALPAKARKDRGAAMATPRRSLRIDRVTVDGLAGQPEAAQVVDAALARLPGVLEDRLGDDRGEGSAGELQVPLSVGPRTDPARLAREIADALLGSGAAEIGTLRLGVRASGGFDAAPSRTLLARLASGDVDGIAEQLIAERKTLDAGLQGRLAQFFGDEFKDVLIFAGPMAGALARSLEAEAVTHGQMVFFDPVHFRTDTPQGEALMAHELAHTRQQDDGRDVRMKEAEALATEASYLDWIRPGGAPLAQDYPLDPTAPSAASAGDVAGGLHRAPAGRHLETTAGPRADTAKQEQRVDQVLHRVRELLAHDGEWEGDRVGALRRLFTRGF